MNSSKRTDIHRVDTRKLIGYVNEQLDGLRAINDELERGSKRRTRVLLRFIALQLTGGVLLFLVSILVTSVDVRGILQNLANTLISSVLLFVLIGIYWQRWEESFSLLSKGSPQFDRVLTRGNRLISYLQLIEKQDAITPDMAMHEEAERLFQIWRDEALNFTDLEWEK